MTPGRGSSGGLRGRKRDVHEGGIREPGLARWPGHIKPGTESDEMIHVTDMFATLLSFTGCKPPSDRIIDGIEAGDANPQSVFTLAATFGLDATLAAAAYQEVFEQARGWVGR